MVDTTAKAPTIREAKAVATVVLGKEAFQVCIYKSRPGQTMMNHVFIPVGQRQLHVQGRRPHCGRDRRRVRRQEDLRPHPALPPHQPQLGQGQVGTGRGQ